jgi:hypothetical protein
MQGEFRDFDLTYHHDLEADRQWRRWQRAVAQLDPADVLRVIDASLAAEPDPAAHPLAGLVNYLLQHERSPGSPQALFERFRALADHAIEVCVEQILADPARWEVD